MGEADPIREPRQMHTCLLGTQAYAVAEAGWKQTSH
jgi:hypothetical protein